ncbi:MAG: RHS repeat-associated core domain-containing protein [Bacteroidetes bacterium]|jgi:RHS repeat-associated protein|nr:RHS repeat-associated core domain-containing protein [Bacteroidota bacterium]MBT7142945.1 RHS repeat-associated core domain-containing protein [Bacteroidota bacterium]
MGCLKLDISDNHFTILEVVHNSLSVNKNSSADAYLFGFNGMEMDNEIDDQTGSKLDFGARIYDSRLGRWLALDPLAAKYPFASPYNFTLNNPILFIDPDGKEVWKSTIKNNDGTKTVTLHFDIRVKNSGGFESKDVEKWSGAIASQIETSFSGKSSDGNITYIAKVNMDLSGKDNSNNYTMDFVSDVIDGNGYKTNNVGRMDGEFGNTKENSMQIKASGVDNGIYEEQTEKGVGRSRAHEVGHTGNLRHPSSSQNKLEGINTDGNLMHQSWNPKAGDNLKSNQIDEFSKHVQDEKPNYVKTD